MPLWTGLAAAAMAAAGCAPVAPPPAVAVTVEPPAPATPVSAPAPSVASAAIAAPPPPDRDGDAIPDDADACPDQPGPASPDAKRNGCPQIIVVTMGRMEPPPPAILFARGARALDRKSLAVLDAVKQILLTHPEIKKLAVKGHASNDEPGAKQLSKARAEAVVAALVAAGIDVGRLVAEPHGSDLPIVPNDTKEGRERNRRVDFQVLESPSSCPAPGAPASP